MAHERAHRPRHHRRKKPLRRLAKRAKQRKSAAAQGRQISTLARHLSDLKQTVKEDSTMAAVYYQQFSSPVKTIDTNNYNAIVPLTCGVSQKVGQVGNQPQTNLLLPATYGGTLGWEPIFQPRDLHPGTGQGSRAAVPPWIKLYKQRVRLRFFSGTVDKPTTLTVSVIRVNSKGPIANIKSISQRADGLAHAGPQPTALDKEVYIQKQRDFAAADGLLFPVATSGTPPTPNFPTTNANGSNAVMWNRELWHVEYQKSFTLGSSRNPLAPDATETDNPITPYSNPAQNAPDHNQFSEDCSFTINYGGMKLSSVPPPDSANLALDAMTVTDMAYSNIPPEHKRWLIIQSSDPQIGASVYAPFMQFSSSVSTRVPV